MSDCVITDLTINPNLINLIKWFVDKNACLEIIVGVDIISYLLPFLMFDFREKIFSVKNTTVRTHKTNI